MYGQKTLLMKFIVTSTSLLKQLNEISGVLSTNNTLPILDNFLFLIEGKILTASSSDLETTMTTRIELSKSEEDGSICVPARLLLDILKTFPEQPLTFIIDSKNFGIEIISDSGKYKLSGFDPADFPRFPTMDESHKLTIDAYALFSGINKTLFATGNDELRPAMSGVFFEFNNDNLTFVSTDAHKLVRYKRLDVKCDDTGSFILPKKPLNLLKGLLAGKEGSVVLDYNNANAHFTFGQVELVCRLIDETYPNYEAVIPRENDKTLIIDRIQFLTSIKRVSIFSNKVNHQVVLKIAGSELNISAEDLDYANKANERLTCSYQGEDFMIGFNSRFLIEMLNNLDSDNIKLEMSSPNRGGLLTPDTSDEEEDILMLVMPVMINR